MAKYYFTFAPTGHPYRGGWAEVHAINITDAMNKMERKHPGLKPYDKVLNTLQFHRSGMARGGCYGAFCQEVLE